MQKEGAELRQKNDDLSEIRTCVARLNLVSWPTLETLNIVIEKDLLKLWTNDRINNEVGDTKLPVI